MNYPHLLPEKYHNDCLFREGTLYGLLKQHLLGKREINIVPLQAHIAQYDWSTMATIYDETFSSLIV